MSYNTRVEINETRSSLTKVFFKIQLFSAGKSLQDFHTLLWSLKETTTSLHNRKRNVLHFIQKRMSARY